MQFISTSIPSKTECNWCKAPLTQATKDSENDGFRPVKHGEKYFHHWCYIEWKDQMGEK